jgi:hypothetical protein
VDGSGLVGPSGRNSYGAIHGTFWVLSSVWVELPISDNSRNVPMEICQHILRMYSLVHDICGSARTFSSCTISQVFKLHIPCIVSFVCACTVVLALRSLLRITIRSPRDIQTGTMGSIHPSHLETNSHSYRNLLHLKGIRIYPTSPI